MYQIFGIIRKTAKTTKRISGIPSRILGLSINAQTSDLITMGEVHAGVTCGTDTLQAKQNAIHISVYKNIPSQRK